MYFNQLIGILERFKSVSHESVYRKMRKFIDMSRKSVFEKVFHRKSNLCKNKYCDVLKKII